MIVPLICPGTYREYTDESALDKFQDLFISDGKLGEFSLSLSVYWRWGEGYWLASKRAHPELLLEFTDHSRALVYS